MTNQRVSARHPAQSIRYEVQGRRRTERDPRTHLVRDDVRLAPAEDCDSALQVATAMVADGFTAWIFKIEERHGRKTYSLLQQLARSSKKRLEA